MKIKKIDISNVRISFLENALLNNYRQTEKEDPFQRNNMDSFYMLGEDKGGRIKILSRITDNPKFENYGLKKNPRAVEVLSVVVPNFYKGKRVLKPFFEKGLVKHMRENNKNTILSRIPEELFFYLSYTYFPLRRVGKIKRMYGHNFIPTKLII